MAQLTMPPRYAPPPPERTFQRPSRIRQSSPPATSPILKPEGGISDAARDAKRSIHFSARPASRQAGSRQCWGQSLTRVLFLSVAAGLLLAGCGTVTPVPTTVAMAGMPNPEAALRQSMQHVDAEMAQLGQMSTPPVRSAAQPLIPEDLQRPVSFAWNGPLDAGVAKLAASIGYTFYTTGPAIQQPANVSVRTSSVPVYQVFQALGEQAGVQATVQIDPQHHQVQVIHHS